MIDTHAHINVKPLLENIEQILKNAKNNGVNKIIAIGMDYETSKIAVELANKYENIYASVGLHPSYVKNNDHNLLDDLYNNKKVIAVGEIGLDFYHTIETKEIQLKVFEEQIVKAIKLNLPVIIHTRNSFIEAYNIVKKYKGNIKGVFHCFSSNLDHAKMAIDLGFKIGIDGPVTFNKNEELVEIINNISLTEILIETDSPYLSPMPYRGKINEPANLKYIAQKIAEIKHINLEEVVETTTNNAMNLFKMNGGKNI